LLGAIFQLLMKKAGAIPQIPGGMNGTFKSMEIFGGVSRSKTVTEYHGGGKRLRVFGFVTDWLRRPSSLISLR